MMIVGHGHTMIVGHDHTAIVSHDLAIIGFSPSNRHHFVEVSPMRPRVRSPLLAKPRSRDREPNLAIVSHDLAIIRFPPSDRHHLVEVSPMRPRVFSRRARIVI